MGSETVTIHVGLEGVPFTVHKNLICAICSIFRDVFAKKDERVSITAIQPAPFKLLIDYLYTKTIRKATASMSDSGKAERIRDLCQLYSWADKFQFNSHFLNKTMDAIQDSFLILGKLPEAGLTNAIYDHTDQTCRLRLFATFGLFHHLRTSTNEKAITQDVELFAKKPEIAADFLKVAMYFDGIDRDPRLRDCNSDPKCLECVAQPGRLGGKVGLWQCQFHIHLDGDGGCHLRAD